MDNNKKTYWKDLKEATQSTATGLSMTWEHFQKSIKSLAQNNPKNAVSAQNQSFDKQDNSNLGIVTNLFPHETMPIPDNGRYKLHNEIEDCIVCNKCAEVCPVDCIEIDAIRGTEQVGKASDGSPIRFYAAKFDIDMAKCCFCGLCTVVCPTECLTMTKEFDFSQTDVSKLNYEFGNLNEQQIIEKQKEWDNFQAEKATQKTVKTVISKPLPVIKKIETSQTDEQEISNKPIIKIKKIVSPSSQAEKETTKNLVEKPKLKPIRIKLPNPKIELPQNQQAKSETENQEVSLKSNIKKTIKIKILKPKIANETENQPNTEKENLVQNKSEVEAKPKKLIIKIKLPQPKTENKIDEIDNIEKKASDSEKK